MCPEVVVCYHHSQRASSMMCLSYRTRLRTPFIPHLEKGQQKERRKCSCRCACSHQPIWQLRQLRTSARLRTPLSAEKQMRGPGRPSIGGCFITAMCTRHATG